MSTAIIQNIFKDELSLKGWLLAGATIQCIATAVLPKNVATALCLLLLTVHAGLLCLTSVGLRRNTKLDGIHPGTRYANLPPKHAGGERQQPLLSGSGVKKARYHKDDQVVIFLLGSRSVDIKGRLAPEVRRMAELYRRTLAEANEKREQYGFLGGIAPLLGTDRTHGNVMVNVSYWKSIEGLMAFARESAAHREAWTWFSDGMQAEQLNPGGATKDAWTRNIGVMHEVYYCPESMASRTYLNFGDWGFGQIKFEDGSDEQGNPKYRGPDMSERPVRWPPALKSDA